VVGVHVRRKEDSMGKKFNTVKHIKAMSREEFPIERMRSKTHKLKNKYTRKPKYKEDYLLEWELLKDEYMEE